MRAETRRSYEKRIADLEAGLSRANEREKQSDADASMVRQMYYSLLRARRQGEDARQWAIEQALRTPNTDIVGTAVLIANYVYGPDHGADRPEETGTDV